MGRKTKEQKMKMEDIEKDLTPEQKEYLEHVKAGKTDPVYFAENLLDVKLHPAQKVWLWMTTKTQLDKAFETGLTLNDQYRTLWKDRTEFDSLTAKNPDMSKNILVPSNRWGKTMVTSVKHIWYNFYKIGVRGSPDQKRKVPCGTLNLSPHSNQCEAGFNYVVSILLSNFIYTCEVDGKIVSKVNECKIGDFYVSDNQQKRTVIFRNNTFYKTIPTGEDQASSLAGNPYLYISYDECAQSLHLKAELPAKIMSRLIDFGGPLDLVSTPEVDKPSHQYFFHISKLGTKMEEGWFTLVGKIADNIFLDKKEVNRIIGAIKSTDPAKYRQVAFGEFITTGKKMFDSLAIERLWDGFIPDMPKLGHLYLTVADWGFADTGDPTVFYVLDYTELLDERIPKHLRKIRISFRESIRGGSPIAVLTRAKILQREWNGSKFIHDSSSMGGVIIKKLLQEMNMMQVIDFSASGDKMDMLFCLLMAMSQNRKSVVDAEGKVSELNPDFGILRGYNIPELEEQLGNYQYNPDKGVTDKRLEQDDVMALGMGVWWLLRKLMNTTVKQMNFNPLAGSIEKIFPQKEAQKMHVQNFIIPEKRIM